MRSMVEQMRAKAAEFNELLHYPIVGFIKHYNEQNKRAHDDAKRYISEIDAAKRQINKSKDKYLRKSK